MEPNNFTSAATIYLSFLDQSPFSDLTQYAVLAFIILALKFIEPKNPPKLGSDFISEEMNKSTQMEQRIQKEIDEIYIKLQNSRADLRLARERLRKINRLSKSEGPEEELNSELKTEDAIKYKDLLNKYSNKKLVKKPKKSSDDSTKDLGKKPKKKPKKDPEGPKENSN